MCVWVGNGGFSIRVCGLAMEALFFISVIQVDISSHKSLNLDFTKSIF